LSGCGATLRVALVIQVRVKPNAASASLEQQPDGTWLARVKAPPTEGKANRELIALICAHFGRPRSAVSIRSGAAGRTKLVRIDAA
jgi:uncharacterized protein